MRKLLVSSLVFSLAVLSLFAYTVPTSRGDIELVVPAGYTLEEAYVEMARLYLEERWDHEELLDKSNELTQQVDIYVQENAQLRLDYNLLLDDYKHLAELLESKSKVVAVKGLIGAGATFSESFSVMSPSLKIGALLFEKITVETYLSYPFSLGLTVGFIF